MNKPTVFFSHSSKDAAMVSIVKNRLDSITGGVLDVFQSSDGQSIPFGRNWVHKIEEGLRQAAVMFVFVTPDSIASSWIYFEAGFAYAKDVQVIPVGMGIDIALLKAPLSLLQGFNVNSSEALDNFVSVINKKFSYHFEGKFTAQEFAAISDLHGTQALMFDAKSVFESMTYELYAEYIDQQGGRVSREIDVFFDRVISYLVKTGIEHSFSRSENTKTVLVCGIKIVYRIGKKQDEKGSVRPDDMDKISFVMSPYNLEMSFRLFIGLLQELPVEQQWAYLLFDLNHGYRYLEKEEHIAAVLSMYPEEYSFSETRVGSFIHRGKDVRFSIFPIHDKGKERVVLSVAFMPKTIGYDDVILLLHSLREIGVIKER